MDWVLWDPAYIVSDTRSLLILTDSSNHQLGLGLFTIKKADDATIKPEDAEDMSICGILDLTPKKLTAAEQNYHVSEKEMTGGKEAALRYGKIITTATADYPEDGVSKVALATDSTVSQGKWKIFKMPHIANFDYLNAKAMRLYSWLDQIAFTRLWPMVLLHFPGELITLLDFVSRTALFFFEEAKRRRSVALNGEHVALSASAQVLKQSINRGDLRRSVAPVPEEAFCCSDVHLASSETWHVAVHSYHDSEPDTTTKHNVALLDLSPEQWLSLADLQAVSSESIGGVTVRDMMTVLRGGKAVSKAVVDKVNIWKETGRVSLVKEASMPAPVLVVQATMQRVESEDDHTKMLVPYIPPDTDIALTTLEDLYDTVKDTPAWLKRSLRNDLMLMAHELNFHGCSKKYGEAVEATGNVAIVDC